MQYEEHQMVTAAKYGNTFPDNPLLAAMPDIVCRQDFFERMQSTPKLPVDLSSMSPEERSRILPVIGTAFFPMDYMYVIYDQLYRAIEYTYTTRTAIREIEQINKIFNGKHMESYATQAASGSILGAPGVGKTSTVRRCLSLMPQVIEHTEFRGQPFFCKQVLYLCVECPSDCSIKTLAFNILQALDLAIGSDYFNRLVAMRSAAASSVAAQVKILCVTHHVGLLIVDEIQNAVLTARKNGQIKPLVKFLVELTNDTATSVFFVGTPLAEELFLSEEHLKRRTRGIRLLPLRPDGVYRAFLQWIWRLQVTQRQTELSDGIAKKLFDLSGGIPAYICKLFVESQAQALLIGASCIDTKIIQRAADILAIKVPKTYAAGTYLSDFAQEGYGEEKAAVDEQKEVPRLYATKRGRKASERDGADLIRAFKDGVDMEAFLREKGFLDVDRPC